MHTLDCTHGLIGPCPNCWTVGYLKRRSRKSGGNMVGKVRPTLEQRRVAHCAHLDDERRRLDESGLEPDQRSGSTPRQTAAVERGAAHAHTAT